VTRCALALALLAVDDLICYQQLQWGKPQSLSFVLLALANLGMRLRGVSLTFALFTE
jgi:hypothetical protein